MNNARQHTDAGIGSRLDRWQRWLAALASVLLHLLLLLIVLHAEKIRLAQPEGGGMGGARTRMEFIGRPRQGEQRPAASMASPSNANPPQPSRATRKRSPIQTTQANRSDAPALSDKLQLKQRDSRADVSTQHRAQPPAGDPLAMRSEIPAGQAPGLLARETAPENHGSDRGASRSEMRGPPAPGREPSMDVDGHQIYYDIRNETRLLEWQAQGMTELYFPLPGRRDYMVCPLDIVVRRGSGGCRLLPPGDPALGKIGDARTVVNVVRVYRRGELIWSGPGAYR